MTLQPDPAAFPPRPIFFDPDAAVIPDELRAADGPCPDLQTSRAGISRPLLAAESQCCTGTSAVRRLPRRPVGRDCEKNLVMAMLHPTNPVVRQAGIYRSNRPYKLKKTLRHVLTELKYLAEWADSTGLTANLTSWTDADCGGAYLGYRKKAQSTFAHRSANDLLRHLAEFSGLLPYGGIRFQVEPGRRPIPAR